MYFRYFVITSLFYKAWPFIWTKLNSLHPMMLCGKFGWNWPGGPGRENNDDGQILISKFTSAFGSDKVNSDDTQVRIQKLFKGGLTRQMEIEVKILEWFLVSCLLPKHSMMRVKERISYFYYSCRSFLSEKIIIMWCRCLYHFLHFQSNYVYLFLIIEKRHKYCKYFYSFVKSMYVPFYVIMNKYWHMMLLSTITYM